MAVFDSRWNIGEIKYRPPLIKKGVRMIVCMRHNEEVVWQLEGQIRRQDKDACEQRTLGGTKVKSRLSYTVPLPRRHEARFRGL